MLLLVGAGCGEVWEYMNIKEMVEEFLVCPKCHGHLEFTSLPEDDRNGIENQRSSKKILVCNACEVYYPIEDDIPILLIEEAKKINE
ncbi:MAG: hypothetical protein M0016_02915 [Deltaproteobacteria bacterium]|jgi:uncharacterized protein YbaR (Trm112 family)|nr:hypothetical protein [Deltaproteobacteria bacterium]MDA8304098.1 hypothetical protein [Deltaproteobacteria bacterium]